MYSWALHNDNANSLTKSYPVDFITNSGAVEQYLISGFLLCLYYFFSTGVKMKLVSTRAPTQNFFKQREVSGFINTSLIVINLIVIPLYKFSSGVNACFKKFFYRSFFSIYQDCVDSQASWYWQPSELEMFFFASYPRGFLKTTDGESQVKNP